WWLLFWGAMVITGTLGISLYLRAQIHKLPAHRSMLNVAETIFQTCKTYLIQQGKFLLMLFVLIAIAISYYLLAFGHSAEYEFTHRESEELRIQGVPAAVVSKLDPYVGLRVAPHTPTGNKAAEEKAAKEVFIRFLRAHLTEQEWADYRKVITEIVAPTSATQ